MLLAQKLLALLVLRAVKGLQWNWKEGTDEGKGEDDKVLNMLAWAAGLSCLEKKDENKKFRFKFLQVQGRTAAACSSALSPSNKNNSAQN